MIRRFVIIGIIGIIAATAFAAPPQDKAPAAAPAKSESLPKAEALMDRFIEVTGGKAAYEKLTSEITTGTMEFTAQGLKAAMTTYAAPPDKTYVSMELEGIGKIEQGTSDGVAWDKNAMTGPHVKTGEERAQSLRDATFNSTLNWRTLYPKAETIGVDTLDGEECYKVILTPADGKAVTSYFQKKSGLVVKRTMVAVSQMGETPVEQIMAEYKDFGGILTPTKMIQRLAGQEFTITIDSVKANQEIPADKFDPPAEIKALLKK
jgi:zinc protease